MDEASKPPQPEPLPAVELAKVAEGQRAINRIWELTQASIAFAISTATVTVSFILIVGPNTVEVKLAALQLLSSAFFVILGSYFNRTNHTKQGGVHLDHIGR